MYDYSILIEGLMRLVRQDYNLNISYEVKDNELLKISFIVNEKEISMEAYVDFNISIIKIIERIEIEIDNLILKVYKSKL